MHAISTVFDTFVMRPYLQQQRLPSIPADLTAVAVLHNANLPLLRTHKHEEASRTLSHKRHSFGIAKEAVKMQQDEG